MRGKAAVLAALAAAGCTLWGAWIPAKAALAQVLIGRSFDRAVATGTAPPPWPWADTAPIARLEVPRLGLERWVLAGSGGQPLAFGPGHLTGTPRPGADGNAVIAGHRDTHFAFLADLVPGDAIVVHTASGGRTAYRVTWTRAVGARDTWVTHPTVDAALTLVTCYPFDGLAGQATERYVVRAAARPAVPVAFSEVGLSESRFDR